MMNAIVQLLRNALCCIKDLNLYNHTWLYDSNILSHYYKLPSPLDETTPLEVLISITQLYAVVSTTTMGWMMMESNMGKFYRINRLWNQGKYIISHANNSSVGARPMVQASLYEQAWMAFQSIIMGWNVFFIGISFLWLFANSWHVTQTPWMGGTPGLIHALTVMELCLLPLLYYMIRDGNEKLTKAQQMNELATRVMTVTTMMGHNHNHHPDNNKHTWKALEIDLTLLEFLNTFKPFWNESISLWTTVDTHHEGQLLQEETIRLDTWLHELSVRRDKELSSSHQDANKDDGEKESHKIRAAEWQERAQDLFHDAKRIRWEGYREYLYFVINLIAFYGYMLSVIVFYYDNDEQQPMFIQRIKLGLNNPDADWHGNFAGDLMWTIEPCIILASPWLLNAMTRKKTKKVKTD